MHNEGTHLHIAIHHAVISGVDIDVPQHDMVIDRPDGSMYNELYCNSGCYSLICSRSGIIALLHFVNTFQKVDYLEAFKAG
jgi:hypothetical protein